MIKLISCKKTTFVPAGVFIFEYFAASARTLMNKQHDKKDVFFNLIKMFYWIFNFLRVIYYY